jgi:hypothetical protein
MADIAALRPIVNGLSKNPLRPKKIPSVLNERGSVCASKDGARTCAGKGAVSGWSDPGEGRPNGRGRNARSYSKREYAISA